MSVSKIGFGGGCHWCTEAVFQSLRGVTRVDQGFIQSEPPADSWSEAVIVYFDPATIEIETLISVHIRTHAATKAHSRRSKYRSAIYTFDDHQTGFARQSLDLFQDEFAGTLVTAVLPFAAFKPSDERFHDYYKSNAERPFCKRYIDPKLDLIRRTFSAQALV